MLQNVPTRVLAPTSISITHISVAHVLARLPSRGLCKLSTAFTRKPVDLDPVPAKHYKAIYAFHIKHHDYQPAAQVRIYAAPILLLYCAQEHANGLFAPAAGDVRVVATLPPAGDPARAAL